NKSETFRNFIDGLKDKFVGAWESVMEFKDKVVTAFEAIFAIFKGDEAGGINMLESLGLTDDQIDMITGAIDSIKEQFNVMKDEISQALSTVKDFFIEQFEDVKSWWDSDGALIFSAMQTVVENVFDGIKIAVDFALTFIEDLFERFAPIVQGIWGVLWPTIQFIAETVWEKIKLVIGVAMDLIQGIISGVAALIEGDWERFGEIISETASSIWTRVVEFFTNLKENALTLFGELFSGAVQWFVDMYENLKQRAEFIKTVVVYAFNQLKDQAIEKVVGMFKSVVQWIVDMYEKLKARAEYIKTVVVYSFTALKNEAVARIVEMYNSVKQWFIDLYENVKSKVTEIKNSVVSKFTELKNGAVLKVTEMYNSVKQWFSDLWTNVTNKARDIKDGVTNRFTEMKDNAVAGVKALFDGASEWFQETKEKAVETFDNMVEGAKALPGRIGEAIKNMAHKAVEGITSLGKSMGDKLESVVNGVIGGLNKVLSAIGVDEIGTISINTGGGAATTGAAGLLRRFSTGTQNGTIAENMLGIVNDIGPGNGRGGATQELIQRDGQLFAPRGKNAIVPLKKGDRIFNGAETQSLMSSGIIPRFSRGTGSEGGNTGDSKGLLGTLKDVAEN